MTSLLLCTVTGSFEWQDVNRHHCWLKLTMPIGCMSSDVMEKFCSEKAEAVTFMQTWTTSLLHQMMKQRRRRRLSQPSMQMTRTERLLTEVLQHFLKTHSGRLQAASLGQPVASGSERLR